METTKEIEIGNGLRTNLRVLVDLRDRTLQKARIAFGNRLDAIDRDVDESDPFAHDMIERWNE